MVYKKVIYYLGCLLVVIFCVHGLENIVFYEALFLRKCTGLLVLVIIVRNLKWDLCFLFFILVFNCIILCTVNLKVWIVVELHEIFMGIVFLLGCLFIVFLLGCLFFQISSPWWMYFIEFIFQLSALVRDIVHYLFFFSFISINVGEKLKRGQKKEVVLSIASLGHAMLVFLNATQVGYLVTRPYFSGYHRSIYPKRLCLY